MSKPPNLVQGTLDSSDSQDSRSGAAERMGHRPAPEAGLQRRAAGERRLALPGAAQAGAAGLDHGGVAEHREQPAREDLLADAARSPLPPAGGRELGAAVAGHHPRRAPDRGVRDVLGTLAVRVAGPAAGVPGRGPGGPRGSTTSCGITSRGTSRRVARGAFRRPKPAGRRWRPSAAWPPPGSMSARRVAARLWKRGSGTSATVCGCCAGIPASRRPRC